MKCSRCDGTGQVPYEEDGRWVQDACYHCSTTGQIDEEIDFQDQVESYCEDLAFKAVSRERELMDKNPDGEDFAFAAAENMMSAHDYFSARVMEDTYLFGREISKLPENIIRLLISGQRVPVSALASLPEFVRRYVQT